jgi:hypothetical protein
MDPGDYYLMAVVDANANGKLDEGDGIGYFGVTEFDPAKQQPKAVTLAAEALVSDAQIPITAVLGADGKPVKLDGAPPVTTTPPRGVPAEASGTLAGCEALTAPVFVIALQAEDFAPGAVARAAASEPTFALSVAPGDYLLLAAVDVSGDARLGPGDLVGVHGVTDWTHAPPQLPTLTLASDAAIGGLEIAVTGRLAEGGRLTDAAGVGTLSLDLEHLPAVVSGTVRHPGAGLTPTQVRVSADPGMGEIVAAVPVAAGPGTFALLLAPGTYYLTGIIDEGADGKLGPGDLIGFHGVTSLEGGAPEPVTVASGSLVADADIAMVAKLTEAGLEPLKPNP